ncbi:ComF family protein [Brevibacillus ginsengisoli]|uniref:ComF family protein n=1 Tax=Brevibacillus ginsengisoli TaxID=363854 RepID=UPI003CEFC739
MAELACLLCNRSVKSAKRDLTIQKLVTQLTPVKFYPILYRLLREEPICETCLTEIEVIGEEICEHCGRKKEGSFNGSFCRDCQPSNHTALIYNRSALTYNDWAKNAMALYKYRGELRLHSLFMKLMLGSYYRYCTQWRIGLLTWVPLHPNRLEERGFNQVEQFAIQLGKLLQIPAAPLLVRQKETVKQSKQTGKLARMKSMQSAFALHHPTVSSISRNKRPVSILILDDIYTTGSTLESCAQQIHLLPELIENKIYSLTVCR